MTFTPCQCECEKRAAREEAWHTLLWAHAAWIKALALLLVQIAAMKHLKLFQR